MTNNILYKLPQERKQTFFGIVSIINGILDKTYDFIFELNETKEELKSSNEELSAAYEQIQASEEILREQYDEIVMQKKYIEDIGFNDELTGLLNRQGFIHSLKGKITLEKQGAMILMGIDNFKGLNNTLGHTFGDQVLIKVAQIIKAYSIITDSARFSGDEFIVYLSNIKNISDIDDFLNDIIEK